MDSTWESDHLYQINGKRTKIKGMNILFPVVKTGSGGDIFTDNLVTGLNQASINAATQTIPSWSGYFPSIAGKFCKSTGYDIIHSNTWIGYGFKNELPLLVTEYHLAHDPLFQRYTTPMQRIFYRNIYLHELKSLACADMVTTISRYTQKKIEDIFGYSDSHMIYCGVDQSLFKPMNVAKNLYDIDEKTTVLLYVGNHLRRKGADLLEPIMQRLGDDFLLMTTSGLRSQSITHADNIRPLGKMRLEDLVQAYNLCDILLFPSRLEGFGLCVAEAMACGKPVITTNTSSLPELVEPDKGGILCKIDDVDGFAQAARYLAEDENLRTRMGRFNRQRVIERFTIEEMTQRYISIYQKMI